MTSSFARTAEMICRKPPTISELQWTQFEGRKKCRVVFPNGYTASVIYEDCGLMGYEIATVRNGELVLTLLALKYSDNIECSTFNKSVFIGFDESTANQFLADLFNLDN